MGGVKKKTRFNAKFRRRKDIPHPPGGILYTINEQIPKGNQKDRDISSL